MSSEAEEEDDPLLAVFFHFFAFRVFFVVVLPFVAFLFMPTAPFATRWQNANFVFLW